MVCLYERQGLFSGTWLVLHCIMCLLVPKWGLRSFNSSLDIYMDVS